MRWLPLCLLLLAVPAHAVQPDEILSDAKLEQRARDLSTNFRCLVCQNQSIDESDAPLAKDLRILIREHLTKGDSDAQIRDFVVARYGEVPDLGIAVTFGQVLANQNAQVLGEGCIGFVDGLVLADEAAKIS